MKYIFAALFLPMSAYAMEFPVGIYDCNLYERKIQLTIAAIQQNNIKMPLVEMVHRLEGYPQYDYTCQSSKSIQYSNGVIKVELCKIVGGTWFAFIHPDQSVDLGGMECVARP